MRLRVSIVGFGTVGRRLAAAIHRRHAWLEAGHGVDICIVSVASQRHGFIHCEPCSRTWCPLLTAYREAAVDDERRAGNERGGIAREKVNGRGDLRRLGHAAEEGIALGSLT